MSDDIVVETGYRAYRVKLRAARFPWRPLLAWRLKAGPWGAEFTVLASALPSSINLSGEYYLALDTGKLMRWVRC